MLSLISSEEAHEGGKNVVSFFVGLIFFSGYLFIYNKKLEKNLDTFFFNKSKNKFLKSESQRQASQNQSWCFKNVSTPFTRLNKCLK